MARSLGTLLPGATSSSPRELPQEAPPGGYPQHGGGANYPNRPPLAAATIRALQAGAAADSDRPPPQALVGPTACWPARSSLEHALDSRLTL